MHAKLAACVLYRGKMQGCVSNDRTRSYLNGKVFTAIHAEINAISGFIRTHCKDARNVRVRSKT